MALRALPATRGRARQDGVPGRRVGVVPGEDFGQLPTAAEADIVRVQAALANAG